MSVVQKLPIQISERATFWRKMSLWAVLHCKKGSVGCILEKIIWLTKHYDKTVLHYYLSFNKKILLKGSKKGVKNLINFLQCLREAQTSHLRSACRVFETHGLAHSMRTRIELGMTPYSSDITEHMYIVCLHLAWPVP